MQYPTIPSSMITLYQPFILASNVSMRTTSSESKIRNTLAFLVGRSRTFNFLQLHTVPHVSVVLSGIVVTVDSSADSVAITATVSFDSSAFWFLMFLVFLLFLELLFYLVNQKS